MGLPLPSIFLVAIMKKMEEKDILSLMVCKESQLFMHTFITKGSYSNNVAAGFSLKGVNDKYENMNFIDLEKRD